MRILLVATLLMELLLALDVVEYHKHPQKSNFKLLLGFTDFDKSKQKKFGRSAGLEFDRATEKSHLQLFFEKIHTNTTPRVGENLSIVRGAIKYQYKLPAGWLDLFGILIEDNLAFTDGGKILGIGWSGKSGGFYQFCSFYKEFKVYQSELFVKRDFQYIWIKGIGKYIHLDKNGVRPLQKAKNDYFTFGVKLHAHARSYFATVGTFFGKRIFAVMRDGLTVQHHAMEFDRTSFIALGKRFGKLKASLSYLYARATEVPLANSGVQVHRYGLNLIYTY